MDVGTVARRPDRLGGAAAAQAVRRQAALHRPPSACRRRSSRSSASPSTRTPSRWCGVCDVVTINAPLHPETEHLFNDALIGKMKRGAYLVNTARGKICDRDAIVRALESGQLAGYAGDVWFPQPAPKDHPWRTMPHHDCLRSACCSIRHRRPASRGAACGGPRPARRDPSTSVRIRPPARGSDIFRKPSDSDWMHVHATRCGVLSKGVKRKPSTHHLKNVKDLLTPQQHDTSRIIAGFGLAQRDVPAHDDAVAGLRIEPRHRS